jgi:hypothetical protein
MKILVTSVPVAGAIALGHDVPAVDLEPPPLGVRLFEPAEDSSLVLGLDAPIRDESEQFDEQTCSGSFTISGRWRIIEGTGAYAGARGTGRFEGRGQFFAERLPDGGCSEEGGAFFFRAEITGTVTLPSRRAA